MRMRWIIFVGLLLAAHAARSAERPTVIVVVGASGAPEYGSIFAKSADRWADAVGRAGDTLVQIGRDPLNTGPADKDRLQQVLQAECRKTDVPLWLVLIGHGTYDGHEAKFNLRGPDVSGAELAQWLRPCVRPLAVIDCSSASAPFLNRLSGKGRVVITATRSGSEVNYARFGEYMAAAIADPAADLDKDGQTSLLEAFIAASHHVEAFYRDAGRLATEHALLDDNGDGRGIPADWFQGVRAAGKAKSGATLDGAHAHQWHLVLSAAERAMPPELRAHRDKLELEIEALRARKAVMPEAAYYRELDKLLLSLARIYETSPQHAPAE